MFGGLGRFRCTGVQRERRRAPNMLKRKLRAPDGPQTLKNVSSNRSWPPLLVLGPSQGPPIAPKALSKAPPKPSRALPGPSAKILLAPHHQQTRSGELAAASQQPTACNYQPSVFQHLRKGSGGRRPKALKSGHRALQGEGHCRSEALWGALVP